MSEAIATETPSSTTSEQKFTPETTVGDAMALHPNARWVFASYHLGGCSHCAISTEETISQVAEGYGVPLDKLIDDLNSLFTAAPEAGGENPNEVHVKPAAAEATVESPS